MLSWSLRGTRGVRTRSVCSSCCAHVARSTGAHGPRAPVTRTYATTKKKKPAAPPAESAVDANPPDATGKTNPAQASQPDQSEPPKSRMVKPKEENDKPAPRKKKPAPSAAKASKGPTAPAPDNSGEPDETAKLWKETLDILKTLQKPQGAASAAPAQATSDGDGGKKNASKKNASKKDGGNKDGGKKDGEDTKRSLKSQFPPLQSAQANKARERQAKLLEGTLDILKSVLATQADQRNESSKTAKVAKTPGPTAKTAKPERKQPVNKSGKEGAKVPSGNKLKSREASVAQGFAALLQEEKAKQAAARAAGPKDNKVEKAPPAPPIPEKDDPAGAGNDGTMGWGLSKTKRKISKVATKNSGLKPVHVDTAPVPRVEYGLDRVLFNEGVYVLQDPRTRVFNFDPYLATIMPVNEFDFDALKQYVTSSKDTTLIEVAKKHNKKFTGSTSSMTSTLAHFHYLLSSWRPINPERISKGYEPDSDNFGAILRAPAATFLHYKDGTYAIDADKEYDSDTILSMLGKSMEKLLTAPRKEYEKYHRSNSHQLTEEERNADESYHYTTFGDFMMRSQLDAYDPRLPGTGVFDLKTRAVVSIRMDARNHERGTGYELRQRQGQWESFEREYYDMIRLAFLKYSLQVRMGRMDGIFVAYHNTERIFGFQYIPLEEMDLSIHGTTDLTTGNREFMASLELWEELLKKATERFPEKSLRIHVETRTSNVVPFMYFFAEPVSDDEIKAIQEKNKEEGEKFQERVLGIRPKPEATAEAARAELDEAEEASTVDISAAEDEAEPGDMAVEPAREAEEDAQEIDEEDSEDVWEDMMDVVEQTMENDAQGISAIRDAIEDALQQSGLLHARSSEEADQYVEALLKAIVDVDAEKAKSDNETATEVPQSESETPEEQQQAQHVRPTEETDTVQPADGSPPAPQTSRFNFLSGWFGSGPKDADTAAKKEQTMSEMEQDQNTNASSEKEPAPEAAATEADGLEGKSTDERSDESLKDLLIKLTTRVGSSSDAQKATEELSEDQAKLRNFESILLDMMPKTQETPAEAAVEEKESASGDEDKRSPEDTPAAGGSGGEAEPTTKPLLGLVLTIRNKVNGKYVQRPEKLVKGEKWHVEYTIDEVPETRAQNLYASVKTRRHKAHYKEPGRDAFKSAFDGLLKHYTRAGRQFRKQETEMTRDLPVFVVGQDPGYVTKTWQARRHTTQLEAKGKTPFRPVTEFIPPQPESQKEVEARVKEYNALKATRREASFRQFVTKKLSLKDDETGKTAKEGETSGVGEVTKDGSSSFREWREKNQPAQDKDKEQEQEKEKERKNDS
ncbi:hypothetical protein KVR01_010743 [Diaporthe batatas]|uniref:uncharacterized protein n=1 Tax=Diaporthe batatas TaxID=748121 RepID=UPI001D053162|nr:uncharacterized protein KVR01_010743 [Diaporthe batatas]KAG8159082.1 hypothetical protein KVR01_010743 [Diaporthe batatas]